MKNWICVLLSLFLLVGLANAGEWVNLTASLDPPSATVLESGSNRILLQSEINGFERQSLWINGEEFQFVALVGESYQWQTGYPELPRLCRSVIIPDQGRLAVRVIASEYRDVPNLKIAPSKGHLLRNVNPAEVPFEFGPAYQQDAWYPAEMVTLREPYILRDLRGQVVEINAFQYNPVRQVLRVYTNLTVEVSVAGPGGENELNRTAPLTKLDPTFRSLYARHFLNYNPLDYTQVDEIGPMLVITYDTFYSAIQPLVDWKNQKGIPTTLVPVSTIGNNSTAIKNYIRDLYQTTSLAYVLIVGDNAQVTSWMIGSAGCDPVYGQHTGNDHYFELFVGRLSAENVAQVENQVTKFVEYEKLPQAGAAWYAKGLGIASNQGTGAGHYGENDSTHINLIRGDLLRYGFTQVDKVYDSWGTQAMITNYLNNGRSMINYCGHGSTTSWGTTGFSNTQVNALANDNMLPVITSVACVNGSFTGTTCFAEAWLRASHTGEPSGAIGFWGSSQNQSWAPPMYAQDEYVDLLCDDVMHAYGALCFNGAMLMIDETGSTGNSEADHWVVFGDPSLQLRTQPPTTMTVTAPGSVNYGQASIAVTVSGAASGGALAALSAAGILLGYGYTDAGGQATLNLTWTPVGTSALLTVTSYNRTPYLVELPIVGGGAPAIDITMTPVSPPIQIPAAGGSFNFDVTLANNAGSTYGFDAWIMQLLPNGTWQGPMLGPVSLSMPAGGSLSRARTQNVPGSALPGTYTYRGYVGQYADLKWDSSSFTYTKLGTGFDQPGHDNWANTGEPLDGELESSAQLSANNLKLSVAPNPFNPTTVTSFELRVPSYVNLRVYDTTGRLVQTLVEGWREAGVHQVTFDGSNLASGLYLYNLQAEGQSVSGKMMLVK